MFLRVLSLQKQKLRDKDYGRGRCQNGDSPLALDIGDPELFMRMGFTVTSKPFVYLSDCTFGRLFIYSTLLFSRNLMFLYTMYLRDRI